MDRRSVRLLTWTTLVLIVTATVTQAAKPKLIRRLSGSKPLATAPATEPIEWQPDLKTAHRISQETGRPMLLVFGGAHCTYCRQLEKQTLGQPALASFINTAFVPVHLDYDRDQRAAKILKITSLPTCVILSPDATELGSVKGFVRAPEFTRVLHEALNYQKALQAEAAAEEQ
ncbi:MAG: thioredoxin family protein [Planctomycetales bacterium]